MGGRGAHRKQFRRRDPPHLLQVRIRAQPSFHRPGEEIELTVAITDLRPLRAAQVNMTPAQITL
jgi:hypothetical protein